MSKPDPIEFKTPDGIWLSLYHFVDDNAGASSKPRKPVLLLHGASANHGTFTTPGGLAPWLAARNFDPWLLDWRGSGRVVEEKKNAESLKGNGDAYNFNLAAEHDIPAALGPQQSFAGFSGWRLVGRARETHPCSGGNRGGRRSGW